MEKLRTATGREFPCDYFNPFPPAGQVNLRVLGTPLAEVAAVFNNQKETALLQCGDRQLSDHTKVLAIIPEVNAVRVVLGKE